jgi:hypothetical protein
LQAVATDVQNEGTALTAVNTAVAQLTGDQTAVTAAQTAYTAAQTQTATDAAVFQADFAAWLASVAPASPAAKKLHALLTAKKPRALPSGWLQTLLQDVLPLIIQILGELKTPPTP